MAKTLLFLALFTALWTIYKAPYRPDPDEMEAMKAHYKAYEKAMQQLPPDSLDPAGVVSEAHEVVYTPIQHGS